MLSITSTSRAPSHDNDVWFDGLGHDSRDTLYRVPGGAVPQGTPNVLVRFRTFHDDVTGVTLRTWNEGERLTAMQRVASDVPCGLEFGCDYWQATVDTSKLGTLYYRFIVRDGSRHRLLRGRHATFATAAGVKRPTTRPTGAGR